jgi:LysM repeat protein
MKRICFGLLLCLAVCSRALAADAEIEERLNKLSGQIEDVLAAQHSQRVRLDELAKEISNLREQQDKPSVPYATQDSVTRLLKGIEEVDRKRLEDYEKIKTELKALGRTLTQASTPTKPAAPTPREDSRNNIPDKGYEYVVQKNDTLSIIVQSYRQKNIKVTTDQILKANPGLKPEKLKVGQTIFIPAPQS